MTAHQTNKSNVGSRVVLLYNSGCNFLSSVIMEIKRLYFHGHSCIRAVIFFEIFGHDHMLIMHKSYGLLDVYFSAISSSTICAILPAILLPPWSSASSRVVISNLLLYFHDEGNKKALFFEATVVPWKYFLKNFSCKGPIHLLIMAQFIWSSEHLVFQRFPLLLSLLLLVIQPYPHF